MMFLKHILSIFFFFTVLWTVNAQRDPAPRRDSVGFRKHLELSADLLPLLGINNTAAAPVFTRHIPNSDFSLPNYSIFLRYRFSPSLAVRTRVGFDAEQLEANREALSSDLPFNAQTYHSYFSIGLEKRKTKGRYSILTALDLGGGVRFRFIENVTVRQSAPDTTIRQDHSRGMGLGIQAILGFQYQITKRLAISLESSLGGGLARDKATFDTIAYLGPLLSTRNERIKTWGIDWRSISALHLSYAFGNNALAKSAADFSLSSHGWELGTDILPYLKKGAAPVRTVFLRRNYTTTRKVTHQAWRLGLGYSIRDSSYNATNRLAPDMVKTMNIGLNIGHEWQYRPSGGRQRCYAGVEVIGGYEGREFDVYLRDNQYGYEFSKTWDIGLNMLTGYQWNITPNIGLSWESAFSMNYYYQSRPGNVRTLGTPPYGFYDGYIKKPGISFIPIRSIKFICSLNTF